MMDARPVETPAPGQQPAPASYEAEGEAMFHKVFQFEMPKTNIWTLPPVSALFTEPRWLDDELQQLKVQLNDVKGRLSQLELSAWHRHTQKTNKAGQIIAHVRHCIQPELCTQAWCKFGEILAAFRLGPKQDFSVFHSVHLCEAPGAFVTCLNHFLRNKNYNGQWECTATTLNPYYEGNGLSEMIDDDRFIFNTIKYWYFGVDNTGNIMKLSNMEGLRDRLHKKTVHLVTADGSVDCVDNPAEQEALVSQLHYCEVVTALNLLSPDGSLVLKMFTMFEDSSVCLLYLLCCLFKNVSVFKPACSKSGNSEVYVVCCSYHGKDDGLLEILTKQFGQKKPECSMFTSKQLPESYLHQHRCCCRQFMNYQIQTIESNLMLYKQPCAVEMSRLLAIQEYCANTFIQKLQLKHVKKSLRIVPVLQQTPRGSTLALQGKRQTGGSFNARQEWKRLSWQERVMQMQPFDTKGFLDVHMIETCNQLNSKLLESFNPIYGMPIDCVLSSPFCDTDLLIQYNDILAQVEVSSMDTKEKWLSKGFKHVMSVVLGCKKSDCVLALRVYPSLSDNPQFTGLFARFFSENHLQTDEGGGECTFIHCLEIPHTPSPKMSVTERCSSLLYSVLDTLTKIRPGDHLIYMSHPLLTRVMIGLLFLIRCCFSQVFLFGAEDGSSDHVYVMAVKLRDGTEEIVHNIHAMKTIHRNHREPVNLVEFVPIHVCYETSFYQPLVTFNSQWLMQRMNWLLSQEQRKLWMSRDEINK